MKFFIHFPISWIYFPSINGIKIFSQVTTSSAFILYRSRYYGQISIFINHFDEEEKLVATLLYITTIYIINNLCLLDNRLCCLLHLFSAWNIIYLLINVRVYWLSFLNHFKSFHPFLPLYKYICLLIIQLIIY